MKTMRRVLRISAAVVTLVAMFTGCDTTDSGSHSGPAEHYPPDYYAPDVVTPLPRPGTPPVKPEHPIIIPAPPVVRPMPPMAPMPRPALSR